MAYEKLRAVLDGLGEPELLSLRASVRDSPDGSLHEIEGVELPKEQALKLINQALPIPNDER